jgi:hypothetical protein
MKEINVIFRRSWSVHLLPAVMLEGLAFLAVPLFGLGEEPTNGAKTLLLMTTA